LADFGWCFFLVLYPYTSILIIKLDEISCCELREMPLISLRQGISRGGEDEIFHKLFTNLLICGIGEIRFRRRIVRCSFSEEGNEYS